MGWRILSWGVAATHTKIIKLEKFDDVVSVSDYDAFAFDPLALTQRQDISVVAFERRRTELRDLVHRKGGVVLCFLRPPLAVRTIEGQFSNPLALLDLAAPAAMRIVQTGLRLGSATRWGLVKGEKGVTWSFVQELAGSLRPVAFLEHEAALVQSGAGKLVAGNSAGWPVSVEFDCGPGRLCFVPVPVDIPDGQLGAAIARMVEEHYGGPVEISSPVWSVGVSVPGADVHDARIAELEAKAGSIAEELAQLKREKSALLGYKVLLYGYGKSVLEPVVRRAMQLVGFKVLERDGYLGEWDVDMTDEETGASAVGEVEGSEGAINVGKLRQLLDYVEAEENEGRTRKGILVGNGYRLKGMDEPERQGQFTEMAKTRAARYGYCLLATSELFKAVCAVLEAPEDAGLKKHIRGSILSKVGEWSFTRPIPEA